jgi:hypothetical protein
MHAAIAWLVAAPAGALADTDTADARAPGLSVGAEVGTHGGATGRYAFGDNGLAAKLGVGSGLLGGTGLHLYADVTWSFAKLSSTGSSLLSPYLGLGFRHREHHYAPASMDELADRHTGLRASLGLSLWLRNTGIDFFAEANPGVDILRSPSCSFISGVDSVCPHAMSSPFFLSGSIGARYHF